VNLKTGAAVSDTPEMFCIASPPDPASVVLKALHVSLNEPVVAIDDLPAGPARAAIAVLEALGSAGAVWVAVALRSTTLGDVFLYAAGGDSPRNRSLDAAVSFAGTLGFLFDDEEPEPAEDAEALWNEWLDCLAQRPGAVPALEMDGEFAPALPAVCSELPLTKFRQLPMAGLEDGPGRET
jgi:hypothetical protein